jgi:hypothetical protein
MAKKPTNIKETSGSMMAQAQSIRQYGSQAAAKNLISSRNIAQSQPGNTRTHSIALDNFLPN